jgi:hypothetical protein
MKRTVYLTTRDKARRAQQRKQLQQYQQKGGMWGWLHVPGWVPRWVRLLPWSHVLLVLLVVLLIVILDRIEAAVPAATAAVTQGWVHVQQASGPLTANALAYAAFTLVFWSCLPNRGPIVSLLPVLVGTALMQAGMHCLVKPEDCPVCTSLHPLPLSRHLVHWSVVSTMVYVIVLIIKCCLWTVVWAVSCTVCVAQRMWSWVLCWWQRRQSVHTSPRGAALLAHKRRHQHQHQQGSVSSWLWLTQLMQSFRQLRWEYKHAAAGVPAATSVPTSSPPQAAGPASTKTAGAVRVRESSNTSADTAPCPDQHQQQDLAVTAAEPSCILTHPQNSTSSSSSTCRVCGVARGPGVKLFKCSKCGDSADRYCSGVCFKVDWPRHKITCRAGPGVSPGK